MNNNNKKDESIIDKLKSKLGVGSSNEVFDLNGQKVGELSKDGDLLINGKKVNSTVIIDKE